MATIWLDTPNPLHLALPPQWWQDAVYAHDDQLRVMPSQKDPTYRLCRLVRREARLGLQDAGRVHEHPDTVEMIRHFCMPVTTVYRFGPHIAAELQARDLWDPANQDWVDQLERNEVAMEDARQKDRDDETDQRSSDAYKGLKYIKGDRVSLRDINRGRQGPTDNPSPVTVHPAVKRLTGPITKR